MGISDTRTFCDLLKDETIMRFFALELSDVKDRTIITLSEEGTDIYFMYKLDNGAWGVMQPDGSMVFTSYDFNDVMSFVTGLRCFNL